MSITSQVNKVIFFDHQRFDSTNEKTSTDGLFIGVSSIIVDIVSDSDGTYALDKMIAGKWYQMAEGTFYADRPHNIKIDFFVEYLRIRIIVDNPPAIVACQANGYPAVYARTSESNVLL
jgi:hypothetical protein